MSSARFPIPQGTLDMLILHVLSLEAAHGYAIAQRLQQISRDTVQRQSGLPVSGAAPPRTEALAEIGVAPVGNGPRGQVLCAHAGGPPAAGASKRRVGTS